MAPTRTAALLALCVSLLGTAAGAASCPDSKTLDYPAPRAADGWSYRLVADGFKRPRGIAFDGDGALLVVDRGVGLVHLKLRDEGGACVSVDEKTTLVDNKELNHGLAVAQDGRTVYASDPDNVYAWSYDASKPAVAGRSRTLVTNMANSDHTTRTLLLSSARPGLLLVSRGSQSNNDSEALDVASGHAQIRVFNITAAQGGAEQQQQQQQPLDFVKGGDLLGWGLRNSVGVAEHPDGGVWSVENSVDRLARAGEDVHQDNPGEELNYHGTLRDGDADAEKGANYGYPRCFALWDADGFPDLGGLEVGDQFSPVNAGGDTDAACRERYVAPRTTFQAHMAPLDIKFDRDGSRAFVSFHGSWNRDQPVGYKISTVAFSDGQPSADPSSRSAARDILYTEDLSNCPGKCFRPVSLALDDRQRIFFSSDATGEIFVLSSDAAAGGDGGGGGGNSNGDGNPGQSAGGNDEDAGLGMMQVAPRSAAWAVAFAALLAGLLLA